MLDKNYWRSCKVLYICKLTAYCIGNNWLCWNLLTDYDQHWTFITTCKQSLGQGNVFTPMCHSVYGGGDRDPPGQRPPRTETPLDRDPPALDRDSLYGKDRAVRNLLECILVFFLLFLLSWPSRKREERREVCLLFRNSLDTGVCEWFLSYTLNHIVRKCAKVLWQTSRLNNPGWILFCWISNETE